MYASYLPIIITAEDRDFVIVAMDGLQTTVPCRNQAFKLPWSELGPLKHIQEYNYIVFVKYISSDLVSIYVKPSPLPHVVYAFMGLHVRWL